MTVTAYTTVRRIIGIVAGVLLVLSIGLGIWKIDDRSTRLVTSVRTDATQTGAPQSVVAAEATAKDAGLAPFGAWSGAKQTELYLLLIWVVVPPIWFWVEYFFLYRLAFVAGGKFPPAPDHNSLDAFKYGQDISSKIWLATSTALLVLYFGKDLK